MNISPSIVTQARRNGDAMMSRQYAPAHAPRISADTVVTFLVDRSSPGAQRTARMLLRQMATGPKWRVLAAIHKSPSDQTKHMTISVMGIAYHLRLDNRLCVFDITRVSGDEVVRPGGIPWAPPGGDLFPVPR